MKPNPWTTFFQTEGVFPLKGVFPENGRWKNNRRKSLPTTGNYITVGGILQQGVNRPVDGGPAESYIIGVDSVTFSPRSHNSSTSKMNSAGSFMAFQFGLYVY